MLSNILEILLLLEKHSKTDNGAIDQKSSNDRHNHGGYLDQTGVSQQSWKSWGLENFISAVHAKSSYEWQIVIYAASVKGATTYQLP